jgi:hypothetical protein
MNEVSRRQFLKSLAFIPGASLLTQYHAMAGAEKGKTKIRDIKVMILQGPRTYTLVKVESDAGLFGIGEAYGSPGVGVWEGIMALKPELIGKEVSVAMVTVSTYGRFPMRSNQPAFASIQEPSLMIYHQLP